MATTIKVVGILEELKELCGDTSSKAALDCFMNKSLGIFRLEEQSLAGCSECSADDYSMLEESFAGVIAAASTNKSSLSKSASAIDSRLFVPMQRVLSHVENDSVLVKSLLSLPYVRGSSHRDPRGDRRKLKRPDELSLHALSQELISFLRVVTEQGDLKAHLVLAKLLLCLWEETRDSDEVKEFLLYLPVATLRALEETRVCSRDALLGRLAVLREERRQKTFYNAPRVCLPRGKPSKVMALEVQGEVSHGIIAGVCVKPLTGRVYFEVSVKGSKFHDLYVGWKVAGEPLLAKQQLEQPTGPAPPKQQQGDKEEKIKTSATTTAAAAAIPSPASIVPSGMDLLLTSPHCWVFGPEQGRFYHNCAAVVKPVEKPSGAPDPGTAFMSSMFGLLDDAEGGSDAGSGNAPAVDLSDNEETAAGAATATAAEEDSSHSYTVSYPGISLIPDGSDLADSSSSLLPYEWKAGATLGCLLDTHSGQMSFSVDGVLVGGGANTDKGGVYVGTNFTDTGLVPVYSCNKHAGLEFNVGQAPFKYPPEGLTPSPSSPPVPAKRHHHHHHQQSAMVESSSCSSRSSVNTGALREHCRQSCLRVTRPTEGVVADGFHATCRVGGGLSVQTSCRIADPSFFSSQLPSAVVAGRRVLWSARMLCGREKSKSSSSLVTLSVDSTGALCLVVHPPASAVVEPVDGAGSKGKESAGNKSATGGGAASSSVWAHNVVTPQGVIKSGRWHRISVVITCEPGSEHDGVGKGSSGGNGGDSPSGKKKSKGRGNKNSKKSGKDPSSPSQAQTASAGAKGKSMGKRGAVLVLVDDQVVLAGALPDAMAAQLEKFTLLAAAVGGSIAVVDDATAGSSLAATIVTLPAASTSASSSAVPPDSSSGGTNKSKRKSRSSKKQSGGGEEKKEKVEGKKEGGSAEDVTIGAPIPSPSPSSEWILDPAAGTPVATDFCDFRIFGCPLPLSYLIDVQDRGRLTGSEPSLLLYLPLDEGAGSAVHDCSPSTKSGNSSSSGSSSSSHTKSRLTGSGSSSGHSRRYGKQYPLRGSGSGGASWRSTADLRIVQESSVPADKKGNGYGGNEDSGDDLLLTVADSMLAGSSRTNEEYVHVSLLQILAVVTKKLLWAVQAWDQGESKEHAVVCVSDSGIGGSAGVVDRGGGGATEKASAVSSSEAAEQPWFRRLQAVLPSSSEVCSPDILSFLTLHSLCRQLVRVLSSSPSALSSSLPPGEKLTGDSSARDDAPTREVSDGSSLAPHDKLLLARKEKAPLSQLERSFLFAVGGCLVKVLRVNITAVVHSGSSPAAFGLQYPRQHDVNNETFVSRLLVLLLYFVSGCGDGHGRSSGRIEASRAVASGLSVFFPHPSDQAYLLECLLTKKHNKGSNGGEGGFDLSSGVFDAVAALSELGNEALLTAVLRHLSQPVHAAAMVPPSLRPLLLASAPSSPSSSAVKPARPRDSVPLDVDFKGCVQPGMVVCRGPDWVYQDQDGGGSGATGFVIEVCDWLGASARCVRVQWGANGGTNFYRWNVENPGSSRNLFDVSILQQPEPSQQQQQGSGVIELGSGQSSSNLETPPSTFSYSASHAASAAAPTIFQQEEDSNAGSGGSNLGRRPLAYTPGEVQQALIQGEGTLTKRSILSYMKEHAPLAWQERHRLTWSLNTLVNRLAAQDTAELYTAFYSAFGLAETPAPVKRKGGAGRRGGTGGGDAGRAEASDAHSAQLVQLMFLLMMESDSSTADEFSHDVNEAGNNKQRSTSSYSFALLGLLQSCLAGTLGGISVKADLSRASSVPIPVRASLSTTLPSSYLSASFQHTNYEKGLSWNWDSGRYGTPSSSSPPAATALVDASFDTGTSSGSDRCVFDAAQKSVYKHSFDGWCNVVLDTPTTRGAACMWEFEVGMASPVAPPGVSFAYGPGLLSGSGGTSDSVKFVAGITRNPESLSLVKAGSGASFLTQKDTWGFNHEGDVFAGGASRGSAMSIALRAPRGSSSDSTSEAASSDNKPLRLRLWLDPAAGLLLCSRVTTTATSAGECDEPAKAQVVASGLSSDERYYPAFSVYSQDACIRLVTSVEGGAVSMGTVPAAAASNSTTTTNTAVYAATTPSRIRPPTPAAGFSTPPLSERFARGLAELIRSNARASGASNSCGGDESSSAYSSNTLPLGAPSSVLVTHCTKLAEKVSGALAKWDFKRGESKQQIKGTAAGTVKSNSAVCPALHPLAAYLLVHLLCRLSAWQYVHSHGAKSLFVALRSLQTQIATALAAIHKAGSSPSSTNVCGVVIPAHSLHMLECGVAAVLGRIAGAWISCEGMQGPDNRVLVVELAVDPPLNEFINISVVMPSLPGAAPSPAASTSAVANSGSSSATTNWVSHSLFAHGACTAADSDAVAAAVTAALKTSQSLMEWLVKHDTRSNPGERRVGGQDMAAAVQLLFLVLLYHCGGLSAITQLPSTTDTPPPTLLQQCWAGAQRLRMEARKLRNMHSFLEYKAIAQVYSQRLRYLLELRPQHSMVLSSKHDDEVAKGVLAGVLAFTTETGVIASSIAHLRTAQKSADLFALYRCEGLRCLRQSLATVSNSSYAAKYAMVSNFPAALRALAAAGGGDATSSRGSGSVVSSHYMTGLHGSSQADRKAVEGAFQELYSFLTSELRAASDEGPDEVSYTLALVDALGVRVVESDHAVFTRVQIFSVIREILDCNLAGRLEIFNTSKSVAGGSSTLCPSPSSSSESIVLEVGTRVEGNYRSRGRWFPGLVNRRRGDDSFDITYDDGEDENRVSRCNVRLLRDDDGDSSEDDSEEEKKVSPASSAATSSQSVATRAVMKLFILLTLQVATSAQKVSIGGNRDDSTSDAANHLSLPLNRTQTGPSTLGKAVFDVLFGQMSAVVVAVQEHVASLDASASHSLGEKVDEGKKQGSGAVLHAVRMKQDTHVLVTEATELLLALSSHKRCRELLRRPKWISLLLNMATRGPVICRGRVLCILQDVLPEVDPSDLVSGHAAFSEYISWHCATVSSGSADGTGAIGVFIEQDSLPVKIVKALVLLCGEYVDSGSVHRARVAGLSRVLVLGVDESPSSAYGGCYTVSAEAVALVRRLLHTPRWQAVTETVLVTTLVSAQTSTSEVLPLPGAGANAVQANSITTPTPTKMNITNLRLPLLLGSLSVLGGHADSFYVDGPLTIPGDSPHAGHECVLTSLASPDSLQYKLAPSLASIDAESIEDTSTVYSVSRDNAQPANRFPVRNLRVEATVMLPLVALLASLMGKEEQEKASKVAELAPVHSTAADASLPAAVSNSAVNVAAAKDKEQLRSEALLRTMLFRALAGLLAVPSILDDTTALLTTVDDAASIGDGCASVRGGAFLVRLLGVGTAAGNSGGLLDIPVLENYLSLLSRRHREAVALEVLKASEAAASPTTVRDSSKLGSVDTGAGAGSSSTSSSTSSSALPPPPPLPSVIQEPLTPPPDSEDFGPLVDRLEDMGFPRHWCELALRHCDNDPEEALNYILSTEDFSAVVEAANTGNAPPRPARADDRGDHNDDDGDNEEDDDGDVYDDGSSTSDSSERNRTRGGMTGEDGDGTDLGDLDSISEESPVVMYYDCSRTQLLSVYSGPGTNSDRIGGLFPGDEITAIGYAPAGSEGGAWIQICTVDMGFGAYDDDNDDDSYGDSLDEDEEEDFRRMRSSENSDDHDIYKTAWVQLSLPHTDSNQMLFRRGLAGGDTNELDRPPAPMFPVQDTYRVKGRHGAVVREGPELSSNELLTLPNGTTVRVVEETINSDGSVRMHLAVPVDGWITKLHTLVEKTDSSPVGTAAGINGTTGTEGEFSSDGSAIGTGVIIQSDWALLETIDDDMEHWGAGELYRREDRHFESMQGAQHKRFKDDSAEADATSYNRRIRVTGHSGYSSAESSLSSKSSVQIATLALDALHTLSVLYARKAILALILRADRSSSSSSSLPPLLQSMLVECVEEEQPQNKTTVPSDEGRKKKEEGAESLSLQNPGEQQASAAPATGLHETPYDAFLSVVRDSPLPQGGTPRGAPALSVAPADAWAKLSSRLKTPLTAVDLAAALCTLCRMTAFRGAPYSETGLEGLALSERDALGAALGGVQITLDMAMFPLFLRLLTGAGRGRCRDNTQQYSLFTDDNISSVTPTGSPRDAIAALRRTPECVLKDSLLLITLNSLAKNIVHACCSSAPDHCWGDAYYVDDLDIDCVSSSNLHYAQWVSRALLGLREEAVTYAVFRVWTYSLRSSSMSLKEAGLNFLSPLLNAITQDYRKQPSSLTHADLFDACTDLLPAERLSLMACKRLWYEMEDDPAYSRFLQALLHFVGEIEDGADLSDKDGLEPVMLSRSTSLVSGDSSARNNAMPMSAPSLSRSSSASLGVGVMQTAAAAGPGVLGRAASILSSSALSPSTGSASTTSPISARTAWPEQVRGIFRYRPLLSFDRPVSYVTTGHTKDLGGSWTVEFWVRRNGPRVVTRDDPPPPAPSAPTKEGKEGGEEEEEDEMEGEGDGKNKEGEDKKKAEHPVVVHPSYLLSSKDGYIKLLSGGRVFNLTEEQDPDKFSDPVPEKALCMSIGQHGWQSNASEKIFDYCIPEGEWTHIALSSRSSTSIVSLFANGHLVDSLNTRFSLPLTNIGSKQPHQSLHGQLAEIRVWNTAKTCQELQRDMAFDMQGARGLASYLRCRERRGVRIFDSAGLLNNCKLHGVGWVREEGPASKRNPIPSFMISESEEVEGLTGDMIGASAKVVEMTGTLASHGLIGLPGEMGRSTAEVVCFCFRVKEEPPAGSALALLEASRSPGGRGPEAQDKIIEGYLEWCSRGVRSRIHGHMSPSGTVRFTIDNTIAGTAGSTISGSPELLSWLTHLSFEGKLRNGELSGAFNYRTRVKCPAPVRSGQTRVDKFTIGSKCSHKISLLPNGRFCEIVSVKAGSESGQYTVGIEVAPYDISDTGVSSVSSPRSSGRRIAVTEGAADDGTAALEALPQPPRFARDSSVPVQRSLSIGGTLEITATDDSVCTGDSVDGWDRVCYGLTQGRGSVWCEWRIDRDVSGTISFGVSTFAALAHADASVHVNEGTWCYSTSGEASHEIDMSEVDESYQGDRVGVLVDTSYPPDNDDDDEGERCGGLVAFYVNDKEVVRFTNVNAHPCVNAGLAVALPAAERGVRPFFALGSADDQVAYCGLKEGRSTIRWDSGAHPRGYAKVQGELQQGRFEGYCRLWVHNQQQQPQQEEEASQEQTTLDDGGFWFGGWVRGRREGVHLWIESTLDSAPIAVAAAADSASEAASVATPTTTLRATRAAMFNDDEEEQVDSLDVSTTPEGLLGSEMATAVLAAWEECKGQSADEISRNLYPTSGTLGDGYAATNSGAGGTSASGSDGGGTQRNSSSGGGASDTSGRDDTVTFKIRDSGGSELCFKMSVNVRMGKAFESYSQRRNMPASSMRFKLDGEPIDPAHTPQEVGLQEGDVIKVTGSVLSAAASGGTRTASQGSGEEGSAEGTSSSGGVEALLENSTAPYILKVVYSDGATVRAGVEISDNSVLRHLAQGETVEAFARALTRDGVPRYQVVDGWVSEHLRGEARDAVLEVLRERYDPPVQYCVKRDGGAKLRARADVDSQDLGFVAQDTVLSIGERRILTSGSGTSDTAAAGEKTTRLRVVAPEQYKGWVSEKSHIVERLNGGVEDLALASEIERVRRVRQARASTSKAGGVRAGGVTSLDDDGPTKLVTINGHLSVSRDTLFLLNGKHSAAIGDPAASNPDNADPRFGDPSSRSRDTATDQGKGGVRVTQDFETAECFQQYDGRHGRPMVLGSRGFKRGRHYWQVTIDRAEWGCIFIGVCPADASGWMGYGMLNYRATQAFGAETIYGKYLSAGDTVGVLLDMDHGTLSFFKDGEDFTVGKHQVVDLGVAYHNLRRNSGPRSPNAALYPCFGLKHPGDALSIRRNRWMSTRGLSPSNHLARVLNARQIICSWHRQYLPATMEGKQDTPAQPLAVTMDQHSESTGSNTSTAETVIASLALPGVRGLPSTRSGMGGYFGDLLNPTLGRSAIEDATGFPEAVLRDFHRAYENWHSHNKRILLARPLMHVAVDTSAEALRLAAGSALTDTHQLMPGRAFTSSRYGAGSIAGTKDDQIWYIMHGSEAMDSWYWTREELQDLIGLGVVNFDVSDAAASASDGSEEKQNSGSSGNSSPTLESKPEAPVAASVPSTTSGEAVELTFDEFCAMFTPTLPSSPSCPSEGSNKSKAHYRCWTEDEDQAMCVLVNSYADKHSADPLRIEPAQLSAYFQCSSEPTAKNSEGASAIAGGPILTAARAILAQRAAVELHVRYAAMCVLNKAAAVLLPLVDFSLQSSRTLPVVTPFELKLLHSLSIEATTATTGDMKDKGDDEVGADATRRLLLEQYSPSSQVVVALKKVVYTGIKESFWSLALRESTTHTPAPPDEYERPSSIAEVRVNRVVAKSAIGSKDSLTPDQNRTKSVFGQLQKHLQDWDGRQLRRSYFSMEDAGQPRAFFVKFVGEGVDDHGGPYRAVFQSVIGEEAAGLLDLLVPCPNGQAGDFDNRDKLVCNAAFLAPVLPVSVPSNGNGGSSSANSSKSRDRREDFVFLGKLVALAARHRIQAPFNLAGGDWKALVSEAVDGSDLHAVDSHTSNTLQAVRQGLLDRDLLEHMLLSLRDKGHPMVTPEAVAALLSQTTSSSNSGKGEGESSTAKKANTEGSQYLATLLLHLHLTQYRLGIVLLQRGMTSSVPVETFPLFTPEELETVFCGTHGIDVEVLKKATEYDGVEPTEPHVTMFWETVAGMSPEEQAQFVNFCSGRSRLPPAASQFPMTFKLQAPHPQSREHPDKYLPIAQTCFFSLSLPKYSTMEVMREKLLYAVGNTDLMDADFFMRQADGWQDVGTNN